MKIEICESLISSWLRHVQGCLVTQTSWKPSPTWSIARERELTETFEAVRTFARQGIGLQIFKNGSFSQFIRQAEIDVLGVRWNQDVSSPTSSLSTPPSTKPVCNTAMPTRPSAVC